MEERQEGWRKGRKERGEGRRKKEEERGGDEEPAKLQCEGMEEWWTAEPHRDVRTVTSKMLYNIVRRI